MGKRISARIRRYISCTESRPNASATSTGVDVREEYANAFRTQSYLDFWTRVVALSDGDTSTSNKSLPMESTTAARLPSYRLFAEHLLDPDQPMVTRILTMTRRHHPINHVLLSDYFTQTADASILCGLLLKDIDRTRIKYRCIKTAFQSLNDSSTPKALIRLTKFTALSLIRVQAIQTGCATLLKRLESTRNETKAKLRIANKFRVGSAIFLVAITASLSVIVVTHALALIVAMPAFVTVTLDLASSNRLIKIAAQLDAATKGTYILNRDLETVGRLVARLNNDLDHIRGTVKFWVGRGEDDWSQAGGEVARQLNKNDCSFRQQLDELEEHLYLCFMTINRARNLVVKEIMDPGQSSKTINALPK